MQTKISKLAMLTMPCLIAVSLVACGGSSHHSSNGGNHDEGTTGTTADWVVSEGKSNTNMVQVLPEMKDTCIIENGTIAVSGDVWDAYGAWILIMMIKICGMVHPGLEKNLQPML